MSAYLFPAFAFCHLLTLCSALYLGLVHKAPGAWIVAMIAAGLVMTGGASRIEGAEELAEELFHMPVRLATPQHVSGLSDVVNNAIHATGVGLLLYGSQADPGKALLTTGGGDTFFDRVRSWFRGEF